MKAPRTLSDLTVADYGNTITLTHGKTTITGQLRDMQPVMVYDYVMREDPEKAEGIVTGYELNVGGWTSPTIRPNETVEVAE